MRRPLKEALGARGQAVVRRAAAGGRAWARAHGDRERMLPSFLILGGQRCGTTSLYRYLSEHPLVEPPLLKEIQFFTINHSRGLDWYRGHFPPVEAGRHSFDASPYYLFHPLAAGRAAEAVPGAKLIALVRNPVDRAWSHYRHNVGLGVEPLGFEEALQAEPERLAGEAERLAAEPAYSSPGHRRYSYAARGEYEPQLRRWMHAFGPDRLKVVVSEELFGRTEEVFAGVLEFLGLPPHRLDRYEAFTRGGAGEAGMRPETREALHRRFEEPNRRLAELLGRSLPWE